MIFTCYQTTYKTSIRINFDNIMNLKFNIFQKVGNDEWNNDLLKNSYATFFQTTDYLTSSSNKDYFHIFIYVMDNNGNVMGQLGLRIIKTTVMYSSKLLHSLLKIISKVSTRGIWLDGPIIHVSDKKTRIEVLKNILNAVDVIAEKYNLVHVEGYTPAYDIYVDEEYKQEFKKNGYGVNDYVAFILDMEKNIEEIFNDLPKRLRQDINRAKRRNIVVKQVEKYDELKQYLLLVQKWTKTKGTEITDPFQGIDKLWENINNKIERFFLAYQNDELISGLRVVYFNRIVHPNAVISSYDKPTSLGGTLLTWSSLEWAKSEGAKLYDFTGGKKESSSIIKKERNNDRNTLLYYKKKWGGEEFLQYNVLKVRKKITYKLYMMLFNSVRFFHNLKMNEIKKYNKDTDE